MKRLPETFRWFILAAFLLAGGVVLTAQSVLSSKIKSADFKLLAESFMGEFLSAKVRIGDIKLGFLNQITLTGLEIDSGEHGETPLAVEINQVVFKYDLLQILRRNFLKPGTVMLRAPKISVNKPGFPYELFGTGGGSGSPRQPFSRLELEGGELSFALSSLDSEIVLFDIRGNYGEIENGRMHLDFSAQVEGLLTGKVRLRGEVVPGEKRHLLEIELDSVRFSEKISLPLETMNGKVRWVNDEILIDSIRTTVHGWETILKGSVRHFSPPCEGCPPAPAISLEGRIGKGEPLAAFLVNADLKTGELSGNVQPANRRERGFTGKISQSGTELVFDSLVLDSQYQGQGKIDYSSGDYEFRFEKDKQRIAVESNLRGLQFKFGVQLDHVNFFGLDLVTSAKISLKPLASRWEDRRWRFEAGFVTDYFILGFAPFEDLHGTFEISPSGVKNLKATWGDAFEVTGRASFHGKPEGHFDLHVNDFNLKEVREFAARPLPKTLGGFLEGKLKIEGALENPEVIGNFKIKGGTLGRLNYDRAIVQFRGFPPRLPLTDSRIFRGRTELLLTGAIDLSLANVFHGVEIKTPDKLVIWKGWEMNFSREEGDIEINPSASGLPSLALKAGDQKPDAMRRDTDAQNRDEMVVTAGPKFKF